nr:hypothetical protein [Tanacetum cinerariifolium]
MVYGKGKTVRPIVIRFCEVYANVMRMAQESGAGDEDYINRAMIYYQHETGLPFKLRHCWEVSKDSSERLMVTEMTAAEKEQREAFIKIKMRKVECRER